MEEYKVICEAASGKTWEFKVFAFDSNQAWNLGRQKLFDLQQREHGDTIAFNVINKNNQVV